MFLFSRADVATDVERVETKARHMATYETGMCRTRVRVCKCACMHVCARAHVCMCAHVQLRRKHHVKDFR